MSVIENIRKRAKRIQRGKPFTTDGFLKLGSRSAVDKAMSRLVKEGVIERIARGVFFRPKKSRFVGNVIPEVSRVIEVIAKSNKEVIQIHGAEAARRFKLSTQMATKPVYYTSGSSREIKVGNIKVKLIHVSSHRKLQFSGKKSGLALSALWYLGKEEVNNKTIKLIQEGLSHKEFKTLCSSSMPTWMTQAIEGYKGEAVHA